eukprot:156180-Heterocapsa_arctica.AAC.1
MRYIAFSWENEMVAVCGRPSTILFATARAKMSPIVAPMNYVLVCSSIMSNVVEKPTGILSNEIIIPHLFVNDL